MSRLAVYRWPHRLLRPAVLHVSTGRLTVSWGLGPPGLKALPHGGWYERVAGRLFLLYRRGSQLWLRVQGHPNEIALDTVSSEWMDGGRTPLVLHRLGFGRKSRLELRSTGTVLLSVSYRRESWDIPNDFTAMRDPEEDDDFVLFVHRLIQDPTRREHVLRYMAPAA